MTDEISLIKFTEKHDKNHENDEMIIEVEEYCRSF